MNAAMSLSSAAGTEPGSTRKLRLLVFTSLYPNAAQPRHGIFIEERLRHLIDSGQVEATVMAPVPWFPLRHRRFGRYAALAGVPALEQRYGTTIHHPRYPVIPKFGMRVAPSLMFRALLPCLRKLQADGCEFDLIDAHYFYPDGVAAVRLGKAIGKPVVISARGSDVTLIPRWRWPRHKIQWAAAQAAAIITVSNSLKDELEALGVDPGKITVLRNGVDLERFGPSDRDVIRARLGLAGSVWLTVGNLIELKGVHLAIEALARLPNVTLLIAGQGPEEARLRQLAEQLGVTERVRFLGALPHDTLRDYYNAADALIHASSREGMPNVVLEALGCGTPVIAAPFASAREIIGTPVAGQIAQSRSAEAIRAAWTKLQAQAPGRLATRQYAERLGWAPTVKTQLALYAKVAGVGQSGTQPGAPV